MLARLRLTTPRQRTVELKTDIMWFIDGDVEESSLEQRKQNSQSSSNDLSHSIVNFDENLDASAPLPCPCSETTLECHGGSSNDELPRLRDEHSNTDIATSERISSSDAAVLGRCTARQIIRGALIGSALSMFFIGLTITFASKSTVRWAGFINHRVRSVAYSVPTQFSTQSRHESKINRQNLASDEIAPQHRQLRDSHSNEEASSQATTVDYFHNVNLDGELVKDFFHRPHKPRVYYADETATDTSQDQSRRKLASSPDSSDPSPSSTDSEDNNNEKTTITPPKDPQLVVAGKLTVADGPCNVAQMNLKSGEWSLQQRIQLSLYNSYSGGEVYSLLANHTIVMNSNAKEFRAEDTSSKGSTDRPYVMDTIYGNELIVVGAFDTTYRNSQTTYCSVGKWDGSQLSKIGEGLCNSALSKGMKITSAAVAGPKDVYVAGSFQTQVWNGEKHEFVKIFNIAHFNSVDQVWLPLPVGQITCSWCTVTILALAWDSERRQLHVAGKFNAIDGNNIPAGLAVYDEASGHLVAHPGGGLSMKNATQDGVGTAIQLDQETGVLYVMGAFERLTATGEECLGLAAYEINTNSWTCLADPAHSVLPTGGGNMLLTPYGLLVAGKTTNSTTWPDHSRPYTVAVLKATIKKKTFFETTDGATTDANDDDDDGNGSPLQDQSDDLKSRRLKNATAHNHSIDIGEPNHEFIWSWLPGFDGHDEAIHTLSNGFGEFVGTVFIGGDNFISKWSYKTVEVSCNSQSDPKHLAPKSRASLTSPACTQKTFVPITVDLTQDKVQGAIMAISQLDPYINKKGDKAFMHPNVIGYTIVVYCVVLGAFIGIFIALMCNKSLSQTVMSFIFNRDAQSKGISLDTLTYGSVENTNVAEAYHRAMSNRFVKHPHLLTLIDPQEIILHRIIGEGTFGRVWSAKWGNASVAVKEFVFAQAAVAGKSRQQQAIVEEIIGEAGMMAILRHPNVLQLFGCSLTAQAIWIVSELCSLGSLRQVLDDRERLIPMEVRLNLALQVAEGMAYLHTQDPPIIHRDLKSHNIFVHETFAEIETRDKSNDSKQTIWLLKKKNENSNSDSSGSDSGNGTTKQIEQPKSKVSMSAKIGDWGSARASLSGSRTMTHGVGTACWMAPEVLKHARSSKYSDVYGFGIVLWELATRREVYEGLESTQIIAMVANDHLRPEIPEGCPLNDLMVKCWAENPNQRPHFDQIVKELNKLKPVVKTSTYTGESMKVPHWKVGVSSYQKGEVRTEQKPNTNQKKRRTG